MSRKTSLKFFLGCLAAVLSIDGAAVHTTAQTISEERKFKPREFVNMPLEVRQVKNLQSDNWPNELEIVIENISNKTIYFINTYLLFPDLPVPNGISGVPLDFGNIENMDIARVAKPEDPHLSPGETLTLVIEAFYRKGLVLRQKSTPEYLKKIEFEFSIVSFGDGTGYQAGEFLDLRKKKSSP